MAALPQLLHGLIAEALLQHQPAQQQRQLQLFRRRRRLVSAALACQDQIYPALRPKWPKSSGRNVFPLQRGSASRDVVHGGGPDAGVHAVEAPTGRVQRCLRLHAEVHHVGQHLQPPRSAPGSRI